MTTTQGRAGELLRRWEAVWAALCTPDSEDFDAGFQLAPGEQVVLATRYGWSAIDVYVNGQGDAGITNAVVKIYGIAGSVRVLLNSTTIVNGGVTQRVAWRCAGCDKYEVSITPSATPAAATLISAKAFGREASDFLSTTTVTLAGDVTGPSNANIVKTLTGTAGQVNGVPSGGFFVLGLSAAAILQLGDSVNTTTVRLQNTVASVQLTGTTLSTPNVVPQIDNTYNCGTNALRWALVRGFAITSGDLNLTDEERNADWTLREHGDWVEARNRTTGDRFALVMRELDACEERESDYAEEKMAAAARARDERMRRAAEERRDEEQAERLARFADADTSPPEEAAQ